MGIHYPILINASQGFPADAPVFWTSFDLDALSIPHNEHVYLESLCDQRRGKTEHAADKSSIRAPGDVVCISGV